MAKKILIIDDDEVLRNLLVKYLKKEDYEVLTADSGNAAMNVCKKTTPDLILLDMKLPDMLGIDIITVIHKHIVQCRFTKVILITGLSYSVEEIKNKLHRDFQVDDFISKPVDYDILLKKIDKLLSG